MLTAGWLLFGSVLILGGVMALVAVCCGGIVARRERHAEQRRAVGAILVADHDLPAEGELQPRRGCCGDCDEFLDELDAALDGLDRGLAALDAELAGQQFAGEISAWLRNHTESVKPPVILGPEDQPQQ